MKWILRLWWETGNFGPLLIVTVCVAVAMHLLPAHIFLPQLRTFDPTAAPTSLVLGLLLGVAVQSVVNEPSPQIHRSAVGLRSQLRVVRVGILIAVFVGIVSFAGWGVFATSTVVILTMTGEALWCGWLVGHRMAWLLPGIHAAVSALLGVNALRERTWWAWPANPEPTIFAGLAAAMIFLGGVGCEALRPRMHRVNHDE